MKKLALLLLACFALNAFADSGKIKICRHPGFTEALDRQRISIPAKSSFTNSGPENEFVVATTSDAVLGPKPGCVVTEAQTTENPGHKTIGRKSGRLLAQFVTSGASLEAFVVRDFK